MAVHLAMAVDPIKVHPLPKNYREVTENYSSQVKLVERPDGDLALLGCQDSMPFPNPADPRESWKILADLWYR